jgi:hypothetical protein
MSDSDNIDRVRAYVFIQTKPGMAWRVVQNLESKECIRLVDVINGPYGVVAVVEGDSASSVAVAILTGIKKLEGVRDVVVYLAEHKAETAVTTKKTHAKPVSNPPKK